MQREILHLGGKKIMGEIFELLVWFLDRPAHKAGQRKLTIISPYEIEI